MKSSQQENPHRKRMGAVLSRQTQSSNTKSGVWSLIQIMTLKVFGVHSGQLRPFLISLGLPVFLPYSLFCEPHPRGLLVFINWSTGERSKGYYVQEFITMFFKPLSKVFSLVTAGSPGHFLSRFALLVK